MQASLKSSGSSCVGGVGESVLHVCAAATTSLSFSLMQLQTEVDFIGWMIMVPS